ncbi:hypothetical protein OGAPHI_000706 [Ogataea philodendri]|uniref:Vacuolar cation-chloride cotransporter 1 n=1 Tax=Ogataea philodendri TaxID=1378263 RepID=A0A9P8PG46_9ASCO|nr:uncharacterized protein OGAPHI_000706 [Ogataea philodendri]KAH3670995.1 hypothetical protein OGAPHI_000706 [Ogataea philodendri]
MSSFRTRHPDYGSISDIKTDTRPAKLNTLNGVTLPTILNVLSILMFLRFGFVLGQMGILGTLLLLVMSYGIDLLTTLSVSAIATNGTVKGGGAYFMISRSLGVEFGGAIGIIFYIGQALNAALNVAGLIEPLLYNFNSESGVVWKLLPIGYWYQFLYSTCFLAVCTVISLIGSQTVSKAGSLLCFLLIISTLSVPLSSLVVAPFYSDENDAYYSGISWSTFHENLLPNFTKGAAGSQLDSVENFRNIFGIFFPATAGIFAGASMSGDLQNPSKSIPLGTLSGLLITFVCYLMVILSMGFSITRDLLYKDVQVLQTVNLSPVLIIVGEVSTSVFSVIVGIVGAAKLLQAIAIDEILPGLGIFGRGGDDPVYGILFTWFLCQLFLFADINQIATLITMAFLMTFIVTNVACFLLKLGSAPNFRPSFKYFGTSTALMGTIASGAAMFIVDGISATFIIVMLMSLVLFIHYISPPKQWGDVSQSLIYHQVRKYLLKLRQDNVKYWRPQILLLVDNPRTSWKLINFCNHLKKGGLYVLGHVIVAESFQDRLADLRRHRAAWVKLRDMSKIKAFVQIAIAPTFAWGVSNVFLGSGLGGMKPNITILGFYDLSNYKKLSRNMKFESKTPEFSKQVNININGLPTDACNQESHVDLCSWVRALEDLSLLDSNLAVAKGFPRLHIPSENESRLDESEQRCIDLYPIQMSTQVTNKSGKSILTNNFDTYTLILQLGAILHTVPCWKHTHKLRVVVFVEHERDVSEERHRLSSLLEILRINAQPVVLCLGSGKYKTYNYIAKGEKTGLQTDRIHTILEKDEWWQSVLEMRTSDGVTSKLTPTIQVNSKIVRKFHTSAQRRYSGSYMRKNGIAFSMVSNRISNTDPKKTLTDPSSDEEEYSVSDTESIGSSTSSVSRQDSYHSHKPVHNVYQSSAHHLRRPLLKNIHSTSSILRQKTPAFSADTMPNSQVLDNAQGNEPSIMFVQNETDDNTTVESAESVSPTLPATSYDNPTFSFNELSNTAQYLILNELMAATSGNTELLFSTLPTPEIGLHKNEAGCLEYITNLDTWCDGLPPVLLVNAKTVTVTTNL